MTDFTGDGGDNPLLGTWRLVSFVQVLDSGERVNLYGEHPDGCIGYAADGRMYAIVTAEGRTKPKQEPPTDAELLDLQQSMFAYAGSYRVDGNKVTHAVDISWNQSFTGTEQVRLFRLDGDLLTVTTEGKFTIDGREGPLVAVWRKVSAADR